MNILIVDDSKLNRVFASSFIEKSNLELNMFFAESGEEALSIIEQVDIQIVLLDIVMPGIDGVETLRRIKAIERDRDIKVIMYSTVSEKKLLGECFNLGASDFIHKPIEEIEFISRLSNTIKQKALEDDTLAYIEEIKAQKSIISDANVQLLQQEKMAGVGQLAAGVAHEINNPLGFISSNFEVLKEYIDKFNQLHGMFFLDYEKETDLLCRIRDFFEKEGFLDMFEDINDLFEETTIGLRRVTDIVKSLRNFSRVDNVDDAEFYSLNEGVKDTLIIANNNIKFKSNLHVIYGKIGDVKACGSQINQVVLNLIMNAVDAVTERYPDKKGDIYIQTDQNEDYVTLSVKDTGIGISEQNVSDMFNPFFTTKPVGKGLGLGLSVSYDIVVNKHNGKFEVKSELGEGTEIVMYLPKIK